LKRNPRIAILWHGDRETRSNVTTKNNKFSKVFEESQQYNIIAEPVVYNDEFVEEVRQQLSQVDGVLVWVVGKSSGSKH
jgi:hypothetical protein